MKVVVLTSGGLDSTVLLHHLRAEKHDVVALSVNYGQRHLKEVDFAKASAAKLGVEHRTLFIPIGPLLPGSSQTDSTVPVPEGRYDDEVMKVTVVPNRNMVLLAVAGAVAVSHGCDAVAYAAHSGDHTIYPDCRPAFTKTMRKAFKLCDWKPIQLLTPFVRWTKAKIVARGAELGVDFGLTWSCYRGQEFHCGKCGTCVERREAFQLAKVDDPTVYRAD